MDNVFLENAIALVALTSMEIVLGIDNVIFIAILTGRLPKERQASARRLGLAMAMIMRILLLFMLSWILSLEKPIIELTSLGIFTDWLREHSAVNEISYRDMILFGGGLFLIGKSVLEIHEKLEGHEQQRRDPKSVSFVSVLIQIALLDLVFSLDSVITAVGMAESIAVMIVAIILAVIVMLVFAEQVSRFVERNPTLKMLALSFLILIGVMLVADGIGTHINKGYIYFAMAFALIVEVLNLRVRARKHAAVAEA